MVEIDCARCSLLDAGYLLKNVQPVTSNQQLIRRERHKGGRQKKGRRHSGTKGKATKMNIEHRRSVPPGLEEQPFRLQ